MIAMYVAYISLKKTDIHTKRLLLAAHVGFSAVGEEATPCVALRSHPTLLVPRDG